jgi:hypothetical protein
MHGIYRLSFTGRATVEFEWGTATLRNEAYDAATNTTMADVDYPDPDGYALLIRFTGTTGGVKNVKLMRPLFPGSSESYPSTTLFTDQFKTALAPFSTLRFMDFTATNWNKQETWSGRVLPDAASFHRLPANYGWQGRGAAWEYVIALANETHKDAWICIPAQVDDDYVLQLARLFRDGNSSAGWPALDPDLKLYIEYSNEVWNWGFDQTTYNDQQATAEIAAGDPFDYNYDGEDWAAAWRRITRKIADASLIFRSVFGDEQMMTRIRPVFEWQSVYKATGQDPLKYLEEAYIPLRVPGWSVRDLLYGGGGSAYYSPNNDSDSLTLDNFWSSEAMDTYHWGKDGPDEENPGRQVYNAQVCHTFGLARVAYEGGPSLDNTGHSEAVKAQAVLDPRMRTAVVDHHSAWSRWGGDLLIYYTLTHNYQWGFTEDVLGLDTPKMQAIGDLLAAPSREAPTLGALVPGTVDGNAFDVGFLAWDEPGTGTRAVEDGRWYSYLFNFPADGLYELSASVSDPSGDLVFIVDGVEVARETLPATGPATVTHVIDLPGGLHSVRVRARGGPFVLNTVAAQPSDVTDTEPPTAPTNLAGRRMSSTRVELTWTASTDDVAVSGYRVYRDRAQIAMVSGPAYTDLVAPATATCAYYVVAVDVGGNTSPPSETVEVLPDATTPPTVGAQRVAGIATTAARLEASVNPHGWDTTVYFEYGTTAAYDATTAVQSLGAPTTPVTASADLAGLVCNTVYHFRAVATSAGGEARGPDATFRTAATGCCTLQFASATFSVSEGGGALIAVKRTGSLAGRVTVAYSTSPGTAQAEVDYRSRSGVLTFAGGQARASFTLPTINDTLDEENETLQLALSDPQGGAQLGTPATATLTIVDNDAGGALRFSAAALSVGEATPSAVIVVTRTGGVASGVTVDYATSDGTASAGSDYSGSSGTLIFAASETRKRFTVPIQNDLVVEGDETLAVTLSNPTGGATLGTPATTTLTIVDNEGDVQLAAASYTVNEGRTRLVTVRRSRPADAGVTVNYATRSGSAVAPDDYTETTGTLTFGAAVAVVTFAVSTAQDTLAEGNETFDVEISSPQGARLGARVSAPVTIADNDAAGVLRFSAAAYRVGEAGGTATITVIRANGAASGVTVDYTTTGGTATSGDDYAAASGTLTFAAGQTSATFAVPIVDDAAHEGNETVTLTLTNPTGQARLGLQKTATLTIVDDDPAD